MTRDLTGLEVGRMRVVGPAGAEHGPLPPVAGGWWLGRCQCGREVVAPGEAFTSRRLSSCGRPTPKDTADELAFFEARMPPPRV